jgi:predicted Zn-dependent peptidase
VNAQTTSTFSPENIDIPYTEVTLGNGLRLIVHEDHKAPIVAVNIWYHVGSKNEKPGKTGFAHLFEHLMFNGSEHYNKDYFQALESIGATDLNGTTNEDRTNYFQNIPVSALDQVLWLESDRMGHLTGVIDQARLDEQRGVVQNEKRQGENEPYGKEYELATKAIFPAGHPYSWTVIGSMEDLNAASLDDVKEWFQTYYGPNNAVICIAGDITPQTALEKVTKYFGNIPAGPTLSRFDVNVPKRTGEVRQSYEDRVTETRITMNWIVPEWGSRESDLIDLASSILSSGKSSRLYKKLVYEDQTTGYVYSYNDAREIAGILNVTANVKPGEDYREVEKTMNTILADFLAHGPTQEELQRVKMEYLANFIKGTERIGGFGGKSDILSQSMVFGGDPEYYKTKLKNISAATVEDIRQVAVKYLSDGKYVLICTPFPEFQVTGSEPDRNALPAVGEQPASTFPEVQMATLKNGLRIALASRKDIPAVQVSLILDAGYASDQFSKPGLAELSMNLLDEGTKTRTALQISDKLQSLGTGIYTYCDLDASYVGMSTLNQSFDEAMDIFSDIILNPAFSQNEFERLQKEQINNIRRERTEPFGMILRVFPKFLYGEGHAYNQPLTGNGYENDVGKFTREDAVNFYNTWFKPNNATLIVVGDFQLNDLTGRIEKNLGAWKKGDVPAKNLATVSPSKANKLYLMDRPESEQSVIVGGYLTEPFSKISQISADALMNIFGGDFVSRLNMNIREDKHWSYGAFSLILGSRGQQMLLAIAPVQTDKTSESIKEIQKEFKAILNDKPVSQEEYDRNKTNVVMQLPGRWETNGAVCNSLNTVFKYGLPLDYYQTYDKNVRGLALEDLRKFSRQVIDPQKIDWFVVGDKAKIIGGLKSLGFSEIIEVDPDGNPLQPVGKVDADMK